MHKALFAFAAAVLFGCTDPSTSPEAGTSDCGATTATGGASTTTSTGTTSSTTQSDASSTLDGGSSSSSTGGVVSLPPAKAITKSIQR